MQGTNEPVRVAIIGTGEMAGLHARALKRVGVPCRLVGVYDLSPERAEAFAAEHETTAYGSLEALLRDAKPHAVHVCTPAGTHHDPAHAVLQAGIGVYIEKPVVETVAELESLLHAARERGATLWPGHQLLFDPHYSKLMRIARALGSVSSVDSHFAFSPPAAPLHRLSERAAADQLIDVLPHPLYMLLETLRELSGSGEDPVLTGVDADPFQLFATFRCGRVVGRLSISLTARPVASTLSVSGTEGQVTADFVRGAVLTTSNPGTSPIEKILNPPLESVQRAWRSLAGVANRLRRPGVYPGLAEGFEAFYATLDDGARTAEIQRHVAVVTRAHEALSTRIRATVPERVVRREPETSKVALVTGAAGFFGREIVAALRERGYSVRGLGRTPSEMDGLSSWVAADLARGVPAEALRDVEVVVHAAAATSGGMDAHRRNSIGATERLLDAMREQDVRRLVYISSLSVLEPPRGIREHQDERAPLASKSERLGAYTWGKTEAEARVQERIAAGDIDACILRPAALVDWRHPEIPGLLGRRLFGRWHLGFARPSLPLPAIDVRAAAACVAWCAENFDQAPDVVNLFDPSLDSRRALLRRFRSVGWSGRFVWVPVSALATAVWTLTRGIALVRRKAPGGPAVWAVLRPRFLDPGRSAALLQAATTRSPSTRSARKPDADVADVYSPA